MFPKSLRLDLRQEKDFFKTARRKSFPLFQLIWKNSSTTQFAVVVPHKVSKKSTARHKLLRQFRNALLCHQTQFGHNQVVLVLSPRANRKGYQEILESLQDISL